MSLEMNSLALFGLPGGWELVVIAFFGLLLFGKRLPEVGKSLGRSIVEFRKGLRGVEEEIEKAAEEQEMLPPPDKAQSTDSTVAQTKTTA